MINLTSIIIANSAAVMLLAILLFSSKKTIQSRLPDNKMFFIMIYSALLQCFLETATFIFDGKTGAAFHILVLLLNSLLFINNIFFAFMWTIYADYKLFSSMKRIIRLYKYIATPAIIIIIFSIVNLFVPIFFSVSSTNVYHRSNFYFFPYIVSYAYLIYGLFLIHSNRKKNNKYLFFPAILFLIPIILASFVQFMFYGISVLWIATAISLTSIYINLQNEISYTDPLSEVFTRQYMNLYLNSEIRKANQKNSFSGIMLDIDRFKSINDRFGHLTGDDAIASSGRILRSCASSKGFVARFAGDEFVIILNTDDVSEVECLMAYINDKTLEFNRTGNKKYQIHFSMGYSVFNSETDTVDSFINRMDNEMYKDKQINRSVSDI